MDVYSQLVSDTRPNYLTQLCTCVCGVMNSSILLFFVVVFNIV